MWYLLGNNHHGNKLYGKDEEWMNEWTNEWKKKTRKHIEELYNKINNVQEL
jgi:hypothetical protein